MPTSSKGVADWRFPERACAVPTEAQSAAGPSRLLPVAVAPTLGLIALRAYPDPLIRLATAVLHPFSARLSEAAGGALRRFAEGLGALRGGSHLFWIAVHSVLIWLVASTLPFLAGFLSLGIDLGSPLETLEAAWLTLAAVGIAVALPSAPGFFGPYHFACKLALVRFGVPAEQAIALGTLVHAVFWVTFTVLGLVVLRLRRTSLGQIDEAAEGPLGPER